MVENWQQEASGDAVDRRIYNPTLDILTELIIGKLRAKRCAGTLHTVHLLGQGNYKNESNTAIFTIDK